MCFSRWLVQTFREIFYDSTFLGHFWYIITFLFRLLVLITLGTAVFWDERSGFICNQGSPGCEATCAQQFNPITHTKFWAFQMLALLSPVVIFHILATYIRGNMAKVEDAKNRLANENDRYFVNQEHRRLKEDALSFRKIIFGTPETMKVFSGNRLREIKTNYRITVLYFFSVAIRLSMEVVFLYLTYVHYNYPAYTCTATRLFLRQDPSSCISRNGNGLDFLLAEYPEFYPCSRLDTIIGVDIACARQVSLSGHVPCWTSGAWEKTLFLRYMNILSVICFFLSALEIILVLFYFIFHWNTGLRYRSLRRRQHEALQLQPVTTVVPVVINADPNMQQQQYQQQNFQPQGMGQHQVVHEQPSAPSKFMHDNSDDGSSDDQDYEEKRNF